MGPLSRPRLGRGSASGSAPFPACFPGALAFLLCGVAVPRTQQQRLGVGPVGAFVEKGEQEPLPVYSEI